MSWSHGFAIEAGPDSSAPAPAAVWVPGLRLDSAGFEGMRSDGKELLGGEGRGDEAREGGNRGRWVRIRLWGWFPSFLASTRVLRAQMEEPRGSWGSLKAAVSPCEDPSVSQGQYDLC